MVRAVGEVTILPADIILVRGGSWFARVIRWFEEHPGDSALYHHAGIGFKAGTPRTCLILEQLLRCSEHSLASAYAGTGSLISIYRPVGLTAKECQKIADEAHSHLGQWYNVGMIPLQALDGILEKIFRRRIVLFRRLSTTALGRICSVLVTRAYFKVMGWTFGLGANEANPDDLGDYCEEHPEKYICVTYLAEIHKEVKDGVTIFRTHALCR